MSDGLSIAEMSMINDLLRMQAISHNLTNVNTTGYKQQIVKASGFEQAMGVVQSQGLSNTTRQQITVEMPELEVATNKSGGAMKFTGNALDIALHENVFMVVKTVNGSAYTRQGDLHIDGQGRLVTSSGLPIMGNSGEIRLTGDKPSIDKQGKIHIDDEYIAQIKLVELSNNTEISPIGGAMYQTTAVSVEKVAEGEALLQGYIEASNVNMTAEMIKMMETTRHFESTQQLIRGYDSMMDNAINVIGDL